MARKLFLKHLDQVSAHPPAHISAIRSLDDGETSFRFQYTKAGQPRSCTLKLVAVDLSEYPDGNTYILFTEDDGVDHSISQKLEIITPLLFGKSLIDALNEISEALTMATMYGQAEHPVDVDDLDFNQEEEEDSYDDLDEYDLDDDNFGLGSLGASAITVSGLASAAQASSTSGLVKTVSMSKIKSDLRAVKSAGFRVGVIGDITVGGIICVSIRITKLGISEEAMEAWGLKRSHYFVLLLRFPHGYRDLDQVKEDVSLTNLTEMRVALCTHYKPSRDDALAAFGQKSTLVSSQVQQKDAPVEPLFIGGPLNNLLRDRFPKLVSYRQSLALNWPSAEAFIHDIQGKAVSAVETIDMDNFNLPDDVEGKSLPAIVTDDALDGHSTSDVSLLLVAMQFSLRHFVRCTEFCLVCHCKVEDTFEALKPYVCSRPLCLYQYMALGFGPSIEWELLSQPYVVDLLISFCYSASRQGRLKDFPIGINLRAPMLPHYATDLTYTRHYGAPQVRNHAPYNRPPAFSAKMDFQKRELLFEPAQRTAVQGLRAGDWIVIRSKGHESNMHHRIVDFMFPSCKLSPPVMVKDFSQEGPIIPHPTTTLPTTTNTRPSTPPNLPSGMANVDCFPYDRNFDDMLDNDKCHAIITILDTIPSVVDMQEQLLSQKVQEPSLKMWRERMSDSALNLLRWIIASNRSCIMQVDQLTQDSSLVTTQESKGNDRVANMDSWVQFRFAQGAPDKEQRFINSINNEIAQQPFPTFFAWHGSPIGNWHSIIRQGLRYDETLHGRAYGNGVYMSPHVTTSLGYSGVGVGTWPSSLLKVSNAISLQEVVNAPTKFVTSNPHYVVADIDWIQTRYLFVQSTLSRAAETSAIVEYAQDPSRIVYGESNQPVKVPITAVPKSRRPAMGQSSTITGKKKFKGTTITDQATAERQEDDANSVVSDLEDLALFSGDSDNTDDDVFEVSADSVRASFPTSKGKKRARESRESDFQPGTLDVGNIKFFDPPLDATSPATKHLMGWLQDAIKVQETTTLYKLGLYINPDHITNVYQWVVELHSFDDKLPLAQEMKKASIKSVVLEMRFTNRFPFSPPFIRVVQPRFLPFNQGGGGHVTEGGAICMELLTNTGWSAVTSLEAVLLQVRLAISDTERPAHLFGRDNHKEIVGRSGDTYAVGEAVVAYERACRTHGWKVPDGFDKFAMQGQGNRS